MPGERYETENEADESENREKRVCRVFHDTLRIRKGMKQ
jgi:hypothetical protein